jgi:hypothetical protein
MKRCRTNIPIAQSHPEILTEWDYSKNIEYDPNIVTAGSNKKVFWICNNDKNHRYKASIHNRLRVDGKKTNCNICSGHSISDLNRLSVRYPLLIAEWDHSKNNITPDMVSFASNKKVWWICPNGHNYYCCICDRTRKDLRRKLNCPSCSGRVITDRNSLIHNHADLIYQQWDFDKNIIDPNELSSGSNIKVWWKCKMSANHKWKTSIYEKTRGSDCPYCDNKLVCMVLKLFIFGSMIGTI